MLQHCNGKSPCDGAVRQIGEQTEPLCEIPISILSLST